MKILSHVLPVALLMAHHGVFGLEDEPPKLRGSPMATFAEVMADRNQRNSGHARRNRDGSYDGHGAWRTSQCVSTGYDCYVGDFCCSGGGCPSCNRAPCKC
ncbi:hypothetical protein ACHAW6_013507 [Cyclotella cf. meneghiniana]